MRRKLKNVFLPLCCLGIALTQALAQSPESPYREGMALLEQGRADQALQVFERGIESDPSNLALLNAAGATLIRLGRIKEAQGYFLRALKLDPEFLPARKNLAIGCFNLNQCDLAVPELERIGKNENTRPMASMFLGMIAGKRKRYDEAIPRLEQAAELVRQHPPAMFSLAHSYFEAGQTEKALRILQELAASKRDGDALNLMAQAAARSGKLEMAIKSLREAIELEPEREDHYLDLSLLCLDNNNSDLALEIIAVGLSHIPKSYRLLAQRGVIYEQLGRRREAKEVFRSAISLQSDHSFATVGLGITQMYGGEFEAAVETLAAGAEKFPRNYYLLYRYGWALNKFSETKGNPRELSDKAKSVLQRAIELNPDFAESHYQLGKLLMTSLYIGFKQFLASAFALVFLAGVAAAQFNSGIEGAVKDTNGAVTPNAEVKVTHEAQGVSRQTKTNEDGFIDSRGGPVGSRVQVGGIDQNPGATRSHNWMFSLQRRLFSDTVVELNY
jgi:tetratricopeptide (TPR) repeat protein